MSLEKGQEFLIWYHQKNGKLRCQFEFFFSLSMIENFLSLWLFLLDWPIWVVVVVFGICQDFFWVTLREIQTLSSLHPLLLLWLFQESLLLQTQVSLAKNTRENLLSVHILLNKILIKAARPASAKNTVLENNRKSLIQHCERSELRLHFELTKLNWKSQKWSILASFWKN